MDYNKQADDFAEKIGLTMSAQYIGHFKRLGDWSTANYRIVLRRPGRKEYSFEFSTSLHNSWKYRDDRESVFWKAKPGLPPRISRKDWPTGEGMYRVGCYLIEPVKTNKPTMYDILSCLTKYDPGTLNDFCSNFGYDSDSIKARGIYFAVQEEWEGVRGLFGDVLDELSEIN